MVSKLFERLIKKYTCLYDCNSLHYNDNIFKKQCREYLLKDCNSVSHMPIAMADLRRKIINFQQNRRRQQKRSSKSFIAASPKISPTDENTDSEPGLSTHNDSDGTASLPEPAWGVKAELPEAPCDTGTSYFSNFRAGRCQENDATQKRTLDTILACLMQQERQNGPSKSFILTSPEINAIVLQELQPNGSRPTDLVESPCAETPQQAMGRETDVKAEDITIIDENTDSEPGLSTHNDSDGTASLPEPACGVKAELPEAPCDTEPYQENDATQKRTIDTILACLMRQERVAERAARAQEAQALALHKIVQLLGETERRK